MIGLDTNVMIRYLVQDEPSQSKRANQQFEKWIAEGKVLWICQVTLCEIAWVLERCYKLSKDELFAVLSTLLQTRQIKVERDDIAWSALKDYKASSHVGFSDCLIGRQNEHSECIHTYTFDKDAAKHLAFTFKLMS